MTTRSILALGAMVFGLLGPAQSVRADIPAPPPRPPQKTVPFEVGVDGDSQQARLRIPARFLNQKGIKRVGDARPVHQTWIAGLALSMAIGSAFFLRRGGRSGRVALMVIVAAGLVLVAGQVWADLAPFGRDESDQGPPLLGMDWPNEVVLEIVPRGDRITLFVPDRGDEPFDPPGGFEADE